MSLKLYFHPLASYCQKVLIALYENETSFTAELVDLGNEASRAAFLKVWPIGKFPVLLDEARARTVPESTIIIEYLAEHYPGRVALVPADADQALQTRARDRFYDLYVHTQMQKIVGDRLRSRDKKDPFGVEQAKNELRLAYDLIEREIAGRTWDMGEAFSMADCAAAPALFYANLVVPIASAHAGVAAYLSRLMARPSVARVMQEAEPYLSNFPAEN
jgi:glutathione S-transferase